MTLRNSLLIVFTAMTVTSLTAGAYIVPGPRPAPFPDRGGGHPQPPYPGDDFGHGSGRQEQKIVYLGRQVVNEKLHLRQLTGINESYSGYTVESVVVDVRSSSYNSEIALTADGRLQQSVYSPQGQIFLNLQYGSILDQDFRRLQLDVRGAIDIQSITVNLREGGRIGRPDRPQRPGRGIDVPLYISRRLYGNDRLDVTQYLDMYRYRGYRIEEIMINATPVYNTALVDVLINGFNQGQSLQFDRYNSIQTVRPYNAVIGQGADSIVLYTRGDMDVNNITLRLVPNR